MATQLELDVQSPRNLCTTSATSQSDERLQNLTRKLAGGVLDLNVRKTKISRRRWVQVKGNGWRMKNWS